MKKEEVIKFYINFRLYIFPAIIALSSLFLIIFAIYPQTVRLIDNQKSADEFLNKSKFLETKVSALENYNEEDLAQKTGLALAAFPADKNFGDTLDLLQRIIAKSGFSIVSITLGNAAGKLGNIDSYDVKLDLQGSKALLPILLSNLDNSPRLIKINSIDISNQASSVSDIAMVVSVLYAGVPKNFGTSDSPLPQITQKDDELFARLAGGSGSVPLTSGQQQTTPRGKPNPFD